MDGINMDEEFDSRIEDAKKFLQVANQADSTNRSEALEDLRFASGDQWPVEIQNSRTLEARPCITINKIDAYVRQVTNQQRQQRPRIKVHGMNTQSDEKLAQIITGIIRHIELQSDADQAYDNAFDFCVRMGWGYWRVTTDYIREDSFDQEIYIKPIINPFTVYFDPNSVMPDGSDAEKVMITEVISKNEFRAMYPDADESNFTMRGTGDSNAEWVMKEDIRIAEYFYTEKRHTKLYLLEDGSKIYAEDYKGDKLDIIDERETVRKVIHWCKLTGAEVLEEGIWAGKYIPIVPINGVNLFVENKRKKFGLVRQAKDPQRMYNFWQTAMTEAVALAPKAKWLLAEGQDEGHEQEWAQANTKAFPVLRFKQTDTDGKPAGVPQRIQPEPPPTGVMAASAQINQDLASVLGIFDPAQMETGNISGKALNGQQQQADLSNYHFYDNLTRSMRWTGKIILDLIPKIYDSERVMRIIGDDGQPDLVTINQRGQDEMGVEKILNDVTVGEYDVVMDTGPGYNSKRIEAVANMMPLMQSNPDIFKIAGDLFIRNMDFPGADVIADRLAASNPLAQIDDKSNVPPQVQMQLAQSQQTIQQLQQQLQMMQLDMKYGASIKEQQDKASLQREQLRIAGKKYDTELRVDTQAHDTVIKTEAQKEIEQMKAQIALILAQISPREATYSRQETTERAI